MFDPLWVKRPFIPIATERLLLRRLSIEDAPAMVQHLNNLNVSERLARVPFPYTLKDAREFIMWSEEKFQAAENLVLAIENRNSHKFMGICSLEDEVGYWLGESFWGQGYGFEAVQALVHFAFAGLNISELKSGAFTSNEASKKILYSLGFEQTGSKDLYSKAAQTSMPSVKVALTRETYFKNLQAKKVPNVWVVAAALIDPQGRLLMAQRPKGKSMAGVWELPGGKIEPGETPEQALVRELHEELHIDVREGDLDSLTFASYHYHAFHLVMPMFVCRAWKGKPVGREGQTLRWVKYADLEGIATPSADISLFHKLASQLQSDGTW